MVDSFGNAVKIMYLSNGFHPDFQFQMKMDSNLVGLERYCQGNTQIVVCFSLFDLRISLIDQNVFGKSVDLTSF